MSEAATLGETRSVKGPRDVVDFVVVTAFVILLACFNLAVASRLGKIGTIWPVNGMVLAVLLTVSPARRPAYIITATLAIALGVLVSGLSPINCLRLPTINLAEILITFSLVRRWIGPPYDLSHPKMIWRFSLIAGLFAPLLSSCLNAMIFEMMDEPQTLDRFTSIYFAHALGMVSVLPFVLGLRRNQIAIMFGRERLWRTLLALGQLVAVDVLAFGQSTYPLLFVVSGSLVVVVVMLGFTGGVLGLFLLTVISISLTITGHGPMDLIHNVDLVKRVVATQLFLAVAALQVLVLAAVLAERDRAQQDLQRATDRLAALVGIDSLTGLANRRKLDTALEDEIRRAARQRVPVSLLLLDVDHFKRYNDLYGHLAGDDCLRAVAAVVARYARRPSDLAARYGGEEFAVLLAPSNTENAVARAEALRADIQALALPHAAHEPEGVVTVSIGVANIRPAEVSASPTTLVAMADAWLYAAKRAGRNRVLSIINAEPESSVETSGESPCPQDVPEAPSPASDALAINVGLAPAVRSLDDIARLASLVVGAPIGLVAMADGQVAGQHGLQDASALELCATILEEPPAVVVPDTLMDPRWRFDPLTTGPLAIRFYVSVPLTAPDGGRLGAICILDRQPGKPLHEDQQELLNGLSQLAMSLVTRTPTANAA